jgi:hypothetical protein
MYAGSKEINRVRQSKMQTSTYRYDKKAGVPASRKTNRQALKRADIGRWLAHAVERRTDKQINVQTK